MTRLYGLLTVKADKASRTIRGTCTTGETDRAGDIVEPSGLSWRGDSVPLLLHHEHSHPLTTARLDPPTSRGVTFEAKFPDPVEPSPFRERVRDAWESLIHGALKGVSIGFRALASEPLPTGGVRFLRAEIYEISLVSIPCNASCTVENIKRYAGQRSRIVRLSDPIPGATSGTPSRVVKLTDPVRQSAPGRPIAEAILRTVADHQKTREEIERRRAIGPTHSLTIDAVAAGAKATDAALAEVRARLAKLEGRR